MRVSKLICGCGVEMARYHFDTEVKDFEGTTLFTGMCLICDELDKQKQGFNKSPHWREVPQKLSAKTLAFLAKGAQEAAAKKFADQYGDKPMSFPKKKRA